MLNKNDKSSYVTKNIKKATNDQKQKHKIETPLNNHDDTSPLVSEIEPYQANNKPDDFQKLQDLSSILMDISKINTTKRPVETSFIDLCKYLKNY